MLHVIDGSCIENTANCWALAASFDAINAHPSRVCVALADAMHAQEVQLLRSDAAEAGEGLANHCVIILFGV